MLLKFGDSNIIGSSHVRNVAKDENIFGKLQDQLYSKDTPRVLFSLGMVNTILKDFCEPGKKISDFDRNLVSELFATGQAEIEDHALKR
jgi:hypothetical protein